MVTRITISLNSRRRKVVNRKKDLIPLALYQIMIGKYLEIRAMQKELEEHLDENYAIKDSKWGFEDLISNSIYGDEMGAEEFVKELKEMADRK